MRRGRKTKKKFIPSGEILLNKYSDKNGIKIWISKDSIEDPEYGIFQYINIEVRKKFMIIPTTLIDYCIDECCWNLKEMFDLLKRRKKLKVARKWIYKQIKNLPFGNTGYYVEDIIFPGGEINTKNLKTFNYDNIEK